MGDIINVDFNGGSIPAIPDGDKWDQIVLKPCVEALGLSWGSQYNRLNRQHWACVSVTKTQVGDQQRDVVTVNVRTFTMWLATISTDRIKDVETRELIEAWQNEAADALEAYWTKGGVINPRATPDQLDVLAKQAAVLQALNGIVDQGWLDAKGRIIGSRAIGETPELDQTTKPLTISIFLDQLGIDAATVKSKQSYFGKKLKAAYRAKYSQDPRMIEDVHGRHTINIAQYQEQHRPLFEQVWNEING
jgi:P22_AR N-terminal domain